MNFARFKFACATLVISFGGSGVAFAQTASQQGMAGVDSRSSPAGSLRGIRETNAHTEHNGVRLSESAYMHVGLGTESGYDSNVFYNATNPISSPVVRIVPEIKITNGHDWDNGAVPQTYYRLGAQLLYRHYISDDDNVTKQNAFNPTVDGAIRFGSENRSNVELSDRFGRYLDPPYGASSGNIDRVENLAALRLSLVPGGGRFIFKLGYTNALNLFLNESLKFADHMAHDVTFDLAWNWFPKTALFLQVSQGYVGYFKQDGTSTVSRTDSYPLRALAGMRGLLTEKLAMSLGAGYANGFYGSAAAQTSGLDNFAGVAELNYAPSELGDTTLGFRHEIRNSPVIGDFYTVETPYLNVRWRLGQRVNLAAFGRWELRQFQGRGGFSRTDNFFQSGMTLDVFLTSWLYAGASYTNTLNRSDRAAMAGPSAAGFEYTKHLVLFRLGLTY